MEYHIKFFENKILLPFLIKLKMILLIKLHGSTIKEDAEEEEEDETK
jgi:hypothetical protein